MAVKAAVLGVWMLLLLSLGRFLLLRRPALLLLLLLVVLGLVELVQLLLLMLKMTGRSLMLVMLLKDSATQGLAALRLHLLLLPLSILRSNTNAQC